MTHTAKSVRFGMIQNGGRTLFCVRVMEKTSTGFCWGSRAVIPLEVTVTVPIFNLKIKNRYS